MQYISSTYLRDVSDYTLKIYLDTTKDYFISVKK